MLDLDESPEVFKTLQVEEGPVVLHLPAKSKFTAADIYNFQVRDISCAAYVHMGRRPNWEMDGAISQPDSLYIFTIPQVRDIFGSHRTCVCIEMEEDIYF